MIQPTLCNIVMKGRKYVENMFKLTHRRGAALAEADGVPAVGLHGPGRVEDVPELAALGVDRISLAIQQSSCVRERDASRGVGVSRFRGCPRSPP